MITLNQIDAGLALIGKTRRQLSTGIGVKEGTLYSYFQGKASLSASRLDEMREWIENHGVEFIDGGVRERQSRVREYHGKSGFWAFYDDIYATVKASGGSILVSGVDDRKFLHWLGPKAQEHATRMAKLKNFSLKSIIEEGDDQASAAYGDVEYRWLSSDRFIDIPFYLYGPKTGIIEFKPDDVYVSVIESPRIQELFRATFFTSWRRAKPIPQGDA